MPELPEVETNRRILEKHICGKTIATVEVRHRKQFTGQENNLTGAKVTALERNGKILAIKLSNGTYLNIHLKLTGQLLYAENSKNAVFKQTIPLAGGNTMPAKSTRVIFVFTDNSALFFNDMRTFGWIKVTREPEKPKAFDVTSTQFTSEYLHQISLKTRKPIKSLLLDQDKLAGIGNIYANEALFEASIHPERSSNSLSRDEIIKLHQSVVHVINEGIEYNGSSGKDEIYVLPDGSRGEYQNHFRVYQQHGKPCKRCGTPIKRIQQAGRGSFFCPNCQK